MLRVLPSSPPFRPVVLAALPLLVVLPLAVLPPRLLRRRRRRRVSVPANIAHRASLTPATEKEESDEDMGFGLFD